MKNRNINTLLIVALVAIWGTLLYRFLNGLKATPVQLHVITARTAINAPANYELTDYSLHDPFLSIFTDTATLIIEPVVRSVVTVSEEKAKPDVFYCGIVKSGAAKTAIIRSGRKFLTLKKGDKIENIMLISVTDVKATVRIDDRIIVLKRNDNQ